MADILVTSQYHTPLLS